VLEPLGWTVNSKEYVVPDRLGLFVETLIPCG